MSWSAYACRRASYAVGQFFRQFSQVTDEEVLEILKLEQIRRTRNLPRAS